MESSQQTPQLHSQVTEGLSPASSQSQMRPPPKGSKEPRHTDPPTWLEQQLRERSMRALGGLSRDTPPVIRAHVRKLEDMGQWPQVVPKKQDEASSQCRRPIASHHVSLKQAPPVSSSRRQSIESMRTDSSLNCGPQGLREENRAQSASCGERDGDHVSSLSSKLVLLFLTGVG